MGYLVPYRKSSKSLVRKYAKKAMTVASAFVRNPLRGRSKSRSANRSRSKSANAPVFRNVKVEGQGGQISQFRSSHKPSPAIKMMKKLNASNYVYNNVANRLTCTPGVQTIIQYGMFTGGTYSSTQTYNNDLAYIDNIVSGIVNTTSHTLRYAVESAYANFRMTNQDLGNVEVIIYDIVCKRDTAIAPDTAWVNGLNDQINGVSTALTASTLPVCTSPGQSVEFNQFYKIKQKTRIILGQGQSHSHNISLQPNKVFNSELLQDANLSYKGWTVYTLICASGMPYNDTTTKTYVTTGQVALDVVATKQMRYTYSSDATTSSVIKTILATTYPVSQSVLDIGSGAVAPDAQA